MKQNLITDNVGKTVLGFSLPFLLSYFLQTLYGMADLYIIGQFCGVESITAVSVGSQVMHMATVMIVGLAMGSVVVIGQAAGASDRKRLSSAVGNTVTLFGWLSLGLTAVLLLGAGLVVRWMSTPEEAVPGTGLYLRICFLGIPLITAYNIISSILRGMGDSRRPMYFIAAACVCNILLDYLFIGYFGLGPAGAALGTVLSQTFSVVLALLVLCRRNSDWKLAKTDFHPDWKLMRLIGRIGIPVAFQDGFIQISFICVTVFANLRGLEDAAAVGIVEKLIGMLFLVPSSMLQTVSVISAQNIGAGKHDRTRQALRWGCGICLLWGFLAVLMMHFWSENIIGCFTSDREIVLRASQYMASYVWDCVFAGIHFCYSGYFCAYGCSGLSFLHNALSITLVRIPLSYIAARCFLSSLFPMGMASTAGSFFSVLVCLGLDRWMRAGKRRPLQNSGNSAGGSCQ